LDEWDKLLNPTDESHDDSETCVGGSGSTGQLRGACIYRPETESECIAVNTAGNIWVAWQPWVVLADIDINV
jgi:hypothetical protein